MKLTINKQAMLILVLIMVSIMVPPSFLPKSDYGTETTGAKPGTTAPGTTSPKIEVIMFYGATRCDSCNNVEKWTLEVLQEYHKEEFNQGSITFQAVCAPKNPDLVIKYNVQAKSLYINGVEFPEAFQYSDSDDHDTFVKLLNQKLESIK
ncbi:MAG: hypothetical protein PHD13_00275 [Methanocellales archaeon]|nr:hypothetical protein [Methanocellales archaeon]MDD3291509.1 hypothetical protein [Methanocellales archaeon]MDD5234601.1 hypothetical protein [Methanocellales archaeon]MDD5485046.1 hypothetical protein [Methanocellales archaeon]